MSKTITIIQLIHLVANNDKKPYQVKYEGNIYTWDCLNHYVDRKDGTSLFCNCVKDYRDFLTDEVEIVEEQEEIDIQNIEELNHYNICSINRIKTEENINDELSKSSLIINKLVQAVKQLDNKLKEK